MYINKLIKIFTISLLIVFSVSIVNAQEGNQFDEPTDRPVRQRDLPELLGLSPEQFKQIRQIRQKQMPLLREANRQRRIAKRDLDQAIYADVIDEAAIQIHLKEFLDAQTEISKIRFMNEMEVRKVLTPDQLEKFRTVRNQFMKQLERPGKRRNLRRNQPNRGSNQKLQKKP